MDLLVSGLRACFGPSLCISESMVSERCCSFFGLASSPEHSFSVFSMGSIFTGRHPPTWSSSSSSGSVPLPLAIACWELPSAAPSLSEPLESESEFVGLKGSYTAAASGSSFTLACVVSSLCLLLRSFLLHASSSSKLSVLRASSAAAAGLLSRLACHEFPLELIRKQTVEDDGAEDPRETLAGEPEEEEDEEKEFAKPEEGPGLSALCDGPSRLPCGCWSMLCCLPRFPVRLCIPDPGKPLPSLALALLLSLLLPLLVLLLAWPPSLVLSLPALPLVCPLLSRLILGILGSTDTSPSQTCL